MKVLLINGSPHKDGNTFIALTQVAKSLNAENIETEIVHIGTKPMQGCVACRTCLTKGRCAFNDPLYDKVLGMLDEIDGIVIGSPTYYAGPNGTLCAFLDRLYYSGGSHLAFKPAACIAVARRGGASTTIDRLLKYFSINNQPAVSSFYWPVVYGREKGEVNQDTEGMETMMQLGKNMAWMIKKLEVGKGHPTWQPPRTMTNFIR